VTYRCTVCGKEKYARSFDTYVTTRCGSCGEETEHILSVGGSFDVRDEFPHFPGDNRVLNVYIPWLVELRHGLTPVVYEVTTGCDLSKMIEDEDYAVMWAGKVVANLNLDEEVDRADLVREIVRGLTLEYAKKYIKGEAARG